MRRIAIILAILTAIGLGLFWATRPKPTPVVVKEVSLGLVEATLACLKRHGFQGASIRKICAEAGVSVGLINHHYAGKDELGELAGWFNRFLDKLQPVIAEASVVSS